MPRHVSPYLLLGKYSRYYKEMPRTAASAARSRPPVRYAYKGRGAYTRSKPAPAPRVVTKYVVKGRGGYWDNIKERWASGPRWTGDAARAAGGAVGGPLGSALGGLLSRGIYALTGFGDYQVKHNVLMETNGPPTVMNDGKSFVMRHREYIGDMYSAGGSANGVSPFAVQLFSINPGVSDTFPWLSDVASNFEQYSIEGIIYEYKSLYSDAVVTQNGSIGSIILATEYNASSLPFASKSQMENYQFAQSCKPSCSVLHPVECAKSQSPITELYVRTGALAANQDIKTYDFGNFQFASQGIPLGAAGAPVALGELWVTYQVRLIKPKLPSTGTEPEYQYTHYTFVGTPGQIAPSLPLGPAAQVYTQLPLSSFALAFNPTARTISFPMSTSGAYRIQGWVKYTSTLGSSTSWVAPTFTTDANITANSYLALPSGAGTANQGSLLTLDLTIAKQTNPLVQLAVLTLNATGAFDSVGTVTGDVMFSEKPLLS